MSDWQRVIDIVYSYIPPPGNAKGPDFNTEVSLPVPMTAKHQPYQPRYFVWQTHAESDVSKSDGPTRDGGATSSSYRTLIIVESNQRKHEVSTTSAQKPTLLRVARLRPVDFRIYVKATTVHPGGRRMVPKNRWRLAV